MPEQIRNEAVNVFTDLPIFYIPLLWVALYFAAMSVAGGLLFLWDRHQAKKKKARVSELWMLVLALLGGAVAMWGIMAATGHKKRYKIFKNGLPVMTGLHVIFFALLAINDHPHQAIEIDMIFIIVAYVAINLLGMFLTRVDKRLAQRKMHRISEDTLMLVAALGGALGMLLSMVLTHHKTRHVKFMLGLPLLLLAQIALFAWVQSDACHIFFIWLP